MKYTFETKYNISDYVYHATPDGDKGIIINISYDVTKRAISYHVVFGRQDDDDVWCDELELSEIKVF